MAASLSGFRAAFPEFNGSADSVVSTAIDRAEHYHTETERGQLLAAAHLISLDSILPSEPKPDGGLSVVKRERMGQREVEYETGSDAWWGLTPYGRELIALEARNPGNVLAAVFG